jgi:hypothetical protein
METFTFSVIIILISFLIYIIGQRIKMLRLRKKLGFDGPPIGFPQFFIGHIYDLIRHISTNGPSSMPCFILNWRKKYGDVFGFYFGYHLSVNIYDPEMIKEIFIKQFSCFVNREVIKIEFVKIY